MGHSQLREVYRHEGKRKGRLGLCALTMQRRICIHWNLLKCLLISRLCSSQITRFLGEEYSRPESRPRTPGTPLCLSIDSCIWERCEWDLRAFLLLQQEAPGGSQRLGLGEPGGESRNQFCCSNQPSNILPL